MLHVFGNERLNKSFSNWNWKATQNLTIEELAWLPLQKYSRDMKQAMISLQGIAEI